MDGVIEIQISGLAQIASAFAESPAIAMPILQKAIVGSVNVLQQNTSRTTVPYLTGRLAGSFQSVIGALTASYFPTANYAPFVYFGTGLWDPAGPHLIYPKSATVMAWEGPNGGMSFARWTSGQPPQKYMDVIAAAATPGIQALFTQALTLITQQLAAGGE